MGEETIGDIETFREGSGRDELYDKVYDYS